VTPRRSARFAVGLLAGLACREPTLPPNHTPAYAFDYFGDVFRWPQDRIPVRYYADPRGAMRAYVTRALDLWERQFLYGEFRAVLVSDSTRADVIVTWTDSVPPDVPPDEGAPVKACGGTTTPDFDISGTALSGPIHTSLTVLASAATPAQLAACMRRTVVHELGHTLGIFQEAPDPDTLYIMYFTPLVSAPADGDRRTVEVLYHTTPTIAPPPR
jgi:predicted Zn-dependent protease